MLNYFYEGAPIKRIMLIDNNYSTIQFHLKVISNFIDGVPVDIFPDADMALLYLNLRGRLADFIVYIDINISGKDVFYFLDAYKNLPVKSKVVVLSTSQNSARLKQIKKYDWVSDIILTDLFLIDNRNLK